MKQWLLTELVDAVERELNEMDLTAVKCFQKVILLENAKKPIYQRFCGDKSA